MSDLYYTDLSVRLYRMGVPESDPIHAALERLHNAEGRMDLSPDEQGALIGNAALAVDREWKRLTRETQA